MREDELRALLAAVARRELTLEEAVERLARAPVRRSRRRQARPAPRDAQRRRRGGVRRGQGPRGPRARSSRAPGRGARAGAGDAPRARTGARADRAASDRDVHRRARLLTVGRSAAGARLLESRCSPPAPPTRRWPRRPRSAPSGSEPPSSATTTSASPACTGCSNISTAIRRAEAVIAVAGMDGALPTLVAGLVRAPVIAVPTSVGYGASFGGLAALLTMLNACAPGVAVVNIDNGYGAAVMAHRICAPRPSHHRTSKTGSPTRSPRGTRRGPAPSRRRRRPA